MAQYSKQVFGMFGGTPVTVRLILSRGVGRQRCGQIWKRRYDDPQNDGTFTLSATVAVSPVFFSWVFSFGGRVKILGPEPVLLQYKDMCRAVLEES